MKTELEKALEGKTTGRVRQLAESEGVPAEQLRQAVADGGAVVVSGRGRGGAVGIGRGLRTKVNASIGTSSAIIDLGMELEKARVARDSGADTLMELSTAGDLDHIRRSVLSEVGLPVGSVPLYQASAEAAAGHGSPYAMDDDLLFEVIERQARDGIGFMAIHCGINRRTVQVLRDQGGREGGVVSRGGAFMMGWMGQSGRENPLYEQFDRLVEILRESDVVLSLGNGMRAGAIADSTDKAQIQELIINAELADRARRAGVQAMLEGPGHIPIDEIEANVILQKRLSGGKPFYMLGPITTDIAPGYDHITAAIGSAWAAGYGTDFICYVTPSEHLGLPYPGDVREGVMAARIAAHVGDMVKLGKRSRDLEMGNARRGLDWERQYALALDPARARAIRGERPGSGQEECSMCGEQCALKVARECV
ncbi:MAG: phosphomethylpyrimidine synthase ThiC [Gaiellales bacterium]|nr:MAG: phosphomethylpyrimidine synthase ThiC [Gaiellales bacterium]